MRGKCACNSHKLCAKCMRHASVSGQDPLANCETRPRYLKYRGKVQKIIYGRVRYFRKGLALVSFGKTELREEFITLAHQVTPKLQNGVVVLEQGKRIWVHRDTEVGVVLHDKRHAWFPAFAL